MHQAPQVAKREMFHPNISLFDKVGFVHDCGALVCIPGYGSGVETMVVHQRLAYAAYTPLEGRIFSRYIREEGSGARGPCVGRCSVLGKRSTF